LRRGLPAVELPSPSPQPPAGRPGADSILIREETPAIAARPVPSQPRDIIPTGSSLPPVAASPPALTPETAPLVAAPLSVDRSLASPIAGDILFQLALSRWNEILEACGVKNRSVQALVRVSRPVGSEGNTLILGFPYEFHRDRIDDLKNRSVVEDIIGRVVGASVRVRCTLANKDTATSVDPLQAAMDDPIVRHAISLGARIRSVSEPGAEERP
jgi:DNA polymerase-3 subunit gamma/tau